MQDRIRVIQEEIAAVTGLSATELDTSLPFARLGIESLQAVNILVNLGQRLNRALPVTLLFDYPTIQDLAEFLARGAAPTPAAGFRPALGANMPTRVAITGLACRFPGADSPEQFWYNLSFGVDSIRETPLERWDWRKDPKLPQLRWGGFLNDISSFDHELFGIPTHEAAKMDPQQRILLECVHEAIESAGFSPPDLQRTRTGVFIGISSSDFSLAKARANVSSDVFDATGNAHSIAANRISYLFNLRGPSLSIDTACSSSLVALHEACKCLASGECDYALVGGVNIILEPAITRAFAEAGMLAPDGRCKTFSKEANGYVRGEGAGVLFLQRLPEAEPARVKAVVMATAVGHEGKTNGLTAPSGPVQEEVIREALARAQLQPHDISFVEAHGTGTILGDPIEFHTLTRIFGQTPKRVVLGSAKAFVGHLEAAAGVCGVIKSVMALRARKWPSQIHFAELNPNMESVGAQLQVPTKALNMVETGSVRVGVSSFGFGGTNSHVILESAPPVEPLATRAPDPLLLLAFSATSEFSLGELAKRFTQSFSVEGADAGSIAETARRKRLNYPHRLAVWGESREALEASLAQWAERKPGNWLEREVRRNLQPRIAFVFTGQGSQYPGMASELALAEPRFRDFWQESLGYLDAYFPHGLLQICAAKDPFAESLLYRTDYGQALVFSLELALARFLEEVHGIIPQVVFGHSLGEISAATFAAAISLPDACRLVAARGRLMQENTEIGAMVSVRAPAADLDVWLASHPAVELAARNGLDLFTLSGSREHIEKFSRVAEKSAAQVRKLAVDRAFHSRLMEPMLPPFGRVLAGLKFGQTRLPLISSLSGRFLQEAEFGAEYWMRQAREPTQFEGMVRTATDDGVNVVVEIGPHPVLSAMGPGCVGKKKVFWIPTLKRGQSSLDAIRNAVAEITLLGGSRPVRAIRASELPATPFTRHAFSSAQIQEPPMNINLIDGLVEEFRALVAGLLHLPVDEVDPDVNLIDLGADSLLLLNAIQVIQDRHGVAIGVAEVFRDLNNLRAIATYVAQNKPQAPTPLPIVSETRTQVAFEMRAAASTPVDTDSLRGLFDRQITLMQQQLALLSGTPPFTPPPSAEKPPRVPSFTPSAGAGAAPKGVLGNFRSKANREVSVDERAKAEYIRQFITRFNQKTPKTKEHTQRHRRFLADNRVSAGFRPNLKEMVYTTIFREGKGARFRDMDGNEFLDLTMGFGVNLFGHCPSFIEARIREQIDRGYCVGPQAELAGIVAEKACKVLNQERIAFLNSGTEAVMTAIRLARAATGRNRVVIFEGSYHGHSDVVLARLGPEGRSLPVAPGVPSGLVGDVLVLPYGEPASLDAIRKHAHELAAVMVEPVQSRYPEHQPVEFLREIRAITEQSGTAFIFDEVIFGLRAAPGGAQQIFGIAPDLSCYGKILGGGMPIGAVAGKARFLDAIDGGQWRFGDDSYPQAEMTFFAGTFCKHPVVMAACDAVLDRFLLEGDKITRDLSARTSQLTKRLNQLLEGSDIEANCFSSLFRFKSPTNIDLLFANINLRGAYVWEGRNLFLSTEHTDQDLDLFVNIVGDSIDELRREGFVRKKP